MTQTQTKTDARRMLLDMATGRRSGYWVEVLHRADDGAAAYMLHTPAEAKTGRTWQDMPAVPFTWDAVRMIAAKHMGDADTADALPQYDEKRTFDGDIADAKTAAAIVKWANI